MLVLRTSQHCQRISPALSALFLCALLSIFSLSGCVSTGQTTIGQDYYPGVTISDSNSTVTVSSPLVTSGSSINVTIYLRDANDNAYASSLPSVSLNASGGTSTGTFGSIVNNGDGSYSSTFTGMTEGTATTVQAVVNGSVLTSALPTVTVTGGSPTSITISSGTGQSAHVGSALASAFQVLVKDSDGNAVSGATINWAVTAGGGSLSSTSNNTSAGGLSSSTLTIGSAGTNSVTATINGTSTSVTFTATGIAFSHIRALTIDHTQVGADLTNFPMLFSGTYSYLATVANGGSVTNANGDDIVFTTDSLCTTQVPGWEIESYSPTTGAVNIWIDVSALSSTTDTVIYMCYGDSSISTFQSAVPSTWNSNYLGVWHMSDDAANTTVTDSTGTNNGINFVNTDSKSVPGVIGKALSYNGSTDGTDLGTVIHYTTAGTPFTVEVWANFTAINNWPPLVELDDSGGNNWELFASDVGGWVGMDFGSASGWAQGYTDSVAPVGTWHLWAVTYDGSTQSTLSNYAMYEDGVLQALGTPSGFGGHANHTYFGTDASNYLDGDLDEIRISNVARSSDWITAEYNNQSSPSTFYSVGSAF